MAAHTLAFNVNHRNGGNQSGSEALLLQAAAEGTILAIALDQIRSESIHGEKEIPFDNPACS